MWRRSEGWRDSATFLRQPRSGPGRRGAPSCLVDPAPDADSESSLAGEIGQPRPASPRVTPEPHPTGPTHWPAEERCQAGSRPTPRLPSATHSWAGAASARATRVAHTSVASHWC